MVDESQRLKVLGDLKIAGTRGPSSFYSIAEHAAELCGAPMAVVSLIDHDTRWFYAASGVAETSTPRAGAACDLAIRDDEPLVIEDLHDEHDEGAAEITEFSHEIRSYLGAPIEYTTGVRLGVLAVFDTKPRSFTLAQIDHLRRLAGFAVEALRLQDVVLAQQELLLKAHQNATLLQNKNTELERAHSDMEVASELAGIGFWGIDLRSEEETLSPSLRRILGLGRKAGHADLRDKMSEDDWAALSESFDACRQGEKGFDLTWRVTPPKGGERWLRTVARTELRSGRPERISGATQDITDTVRKKSRISKLAALDTLTGVHNRRFLPIAYTKLRRDTDFEDQKIVVMLIDVDHFKQVNDTEGHDVGDRVLVVIADILRTALRDGDVVGRLGGDEFMLILRGDAKTDFGAIVAERLAQAVGRNALLQSFPTPVSLSIGFEEVTEDTVEFDDALKNADLAVYEAKRRGRACAVPYISSLGDSADHRVQTLHQIDYALNRSEIVPAYQPKIQLDTGRLIGFEALARWRHPERGLLPPGAFHEALDHPLYGARISEAVLGQALLDMKRMEERGVWIDRVAVNVTESQLIDGDFMGRLSDLCAKAEIAPERIEIELTERILLARRSEGIKALLEKLREGNVTVAFDDFGTGYASLTHLRDFAIDVIKIDRSFVMDLVTADAARAIASSVIAMAEKLKLAVVAEGVEDEATEQILLEMGCKIGQGYAYSKPVLFDEALAFAEAHAEAEEDPAASVSAA